MTTFYTMVAKWRISDVLGKNREQSFPSYLQSYSVM